MSGHRLYNWPDVAALDEHLTVFLKLDEALERFLEDFAFSSHEPYKISTDSGIVYRPSRAEIGDAVDSLGGWPTSFEGWHLGPNRSRSANLEVLRFSGLPLDRIGCILQVFGVDENETNGRFDTLRNRMDAEIKRQWPKPTAAAQMPAPLAVTLPATPAPSTTPGALSPRHAKGMKQWWGRVSMHPLWAAVISGLLVVCMVAVVAALWKAFFG